MRLQSTRITLPDDLEAVYERFCEEGWGDGLPIIPPTPERVARFVSASGRPPDEVVAEVPPVMGPATVEKVAINAVMAGCPPEAMPVLLTAVSAMCRPEFNLPAIQATTNPSGPLLLLNGPVRRALGVNCGSGCMGPGWRANATLGRAVRLILINLGGARPGPIDKATHGWPGKYTFCFGENEEESPWPPLHTTRGLRAEESAVTVLGAQGTSNILDPSPYAEDLLTSLAHGMLNVGTNNFVVGQSEPLLVLNPTHARVLAEAGWTRESLQEYLWERVRAPIEWFSSRNRERIESAGRVVNGKVPLAPGPERILIAVAGGPGALHSVFIPTFGDSRAVTLPIPGEWGT